MGAWTLAKPTTKTRKRPRGSEQYTSAAYRPYVMAIGQLALAWNDLHETLGSLFIDITVVVDEKISAAWQSLGSDRAKRGMLEAVAKSLSPSDIKKNPRGKDDLIWLLRRVTSLEEDRNNAIHSPLRTYDGPIWEMLGKPRGIAPDDSSGNARAKKLLKKNLLIEYRYCRDAVIILRDYAEAIQDAWSYPKNPWPERPQLPNRGQKKTHQYPRAQDETKQLPLLPEASED